MRVVINDAEVTALFSPTGDVGRAARRAAGRVRDRAKQNAPVLTGALRNSITSTQVSQTKTTIVYRIGSPIKYAIFQERGTGPIFPRRAPALVFKTRGGKWVRTGKTRGVPAVHYLERALRSLTEADFRV
jgi:HK97 gp10 family phage protein